MAVSSGGHGPDIPRTRPRHHGGPIATLPNLPPALSVHPLPLYVFLPMFSLFHVPCPCYFPPCTNFVPLRQGAKRVFRRSTECASVPSEGRKGPLEKVFNILSCSLRGALFSATRGKLPSATLDRGTKFRRGYDVPSFPSIVFSPCSIPFPLSPLPYI